MTLFLWWPINSSMRSCEHSIFPLNISCGLEEQLTFNLHLPISKTNLLTQTQQLLNSEISSNEKIPIQIYLKLCNSIMIFSQDRTDCMGSLGFHKEIGN